MLVTLKRTSSVKKECENNVKDYSTSWIWIAGTAFNSPGSSLLTGLLHQGEKFVISPGVIVSATGENRPTLRLEQGL